MYFFVLSRHRRDTAGHHGSCGLDKYREWMMSSAQPASHDVVRTLLYFYLKHQLFFFRVKQINDVNCHIYLYLSQNDAHDDVTMDNIYSRDSNTRFNRHKRAPVSCYSKPERTCNLYLRADPVLFNETRDRLGVRMRIDRFSRFN